MSTILRPKFMYLTALVFLLSFCKTEAQTINETPQTDNSISPFKAAHYKFLEAKFSSGNGGNESLVAQTGIEYDVKYYRLELRINPDTLGGGAAGKYIKGKITTYFTTNVANFTVINFDFGTPLACDSVYYHGVKLAAGKISRPTDLLQLTIPVIPTAGTLDSVSVFYKGVPQVEPLFGSGYLNTKHNTTLNYTYTLSEPYSSFTWWPCKSYIANDKADSMDLIVSTPLGFKAAGNGILVSETTTASGVTAYWKERYPISTYQICTAVANYVQYPSPADTVIIGGTKMPRFNYIFPETNTAAARTALELSFLVTRALFSLK